MTGGPSSRVQNRPVRTRSLLRVRRDKKRCRVPLLKGPQTRGPRRTETTGLVLTCLRARGPVPRRGGLQVDTGITGLLLVSRNGCCERGLLGPRETREGREKRGTVERTSEGTRRSRVRGLRQPGTVGRPGVRTPPVRGGRRGRTRGTTVVLW